MINVGDTYKAESSVNESNTASALKSGGLEVFSTPSMIALMENAAFSLLKKDGFDSVGTMINIKHLRACKVGTNVWAIATITNLDGNWVHYKVEAFDNKGIIGSGEHSRYIIDVDKFMSKIQ